MYKALWHYQHPMDVKHELVWCNKNKQDVGVFHLESRLFLVGWPCSFWSRNLILILLSNLKFIAESWSEILIYPNPEFEFYLILTRFYFILSPKFQFYPLIPNKNKSYPFYPRIFHFENINGIDICERISHFVEWIIMCLTGPIFVNKIFTF